MCDINLKKGILFLISQDLVDLTTSPLTVLILMVFFHANFRLGKIKQGLKVSLWIMDHSLLEIGKTALNKWRFGVSWFNRPGPPNNPYVKYIIKF